MSVAFVAGWFGLAVSFGWVFCAFGPASGDFVPSLEALGPQPGSSVSAQNRTNLIAKKCFMFTTGFENSLLSAQ